MARNRFTNPSNGSFYDWQINHSEEEEFGKARTIEHGANTANTGLVKQQGDDSPLRIVVNGTILHKAQLQQFIAWWQLCGTQTIYFTDFTGEEYEVLITAFRPTRHRTIKNPRDFSNAPLWFWRYTLEMEVVRIRSGDWAGVTP